MGGKDLIDKLQFSASEFIQKDHSPAIASILQLVMLFATIQSLINYQQNILLVTGNFRTHQCIDIIPRHMPVYIFLILMK